LTDIFHEVEEDLRRDRLNKVWARYGTVFLTIAVLAVAATGAFVWWQGRQQANRDSAAEAFASADSLAAAGDLDGALKAYTDIASTGEDGYPTLALFRQASLLTARNDVQGALAIYDKIATGNADERLKALAQIRAAFLVSDTEAPDLLKNRVKPFMGDDNPWRFEARELDAYVEFRARNNAASADAYAKIAADEAAPATMRARAGKMVAFLRGGAILPPEAAEPVAPPAEIPAAPPAEEPKAEAPVDAPAETTPPAPTP
jgi:hypothetical protein